MEYAWTIYVRDVFVILAAAAVVLVSLYLGLVAWQVYRLAAELGAELEPIVRSLEQSARTVETTTGFLAQRFTTPAAAATHTALGLFGLYHVYREARGRPAPAVGGAAPEVGGEA